MSSTNWRQSKKKNNFGNINRKFIYFKPGEKYPVWFRKNIEYFNDNINTEDGAHTDKSINHTIFIYDISLNSILAYLEFEFVLNSKLEKERDLLWKKHNQFQENLTDKEWEEYEQSENFIFNSYHFDKLFQENKAKTPENYDIFIENLYIMGTYVNYESGFRKNKIEKKFSGLGEQLLQQLSSIYPNFTIRLEAVSGAEKFYKKMGFVKPLFANYKKGYNEMVMYPKNYKKQQKRRDKSKNREKFIRKEFVGLENILPFTYY